MRLKVKAQNEASMNSETASKLLDLLKAIDTDHPRDWIDLVCSARDILPKTTEEELRSFIVRG